MLFSIELWRQWQPLIFPPIKASNGALRSVKALAPQRSYTGSGLQNYQNAGKALRDANTTSLFDVL